MKDLERSSFRRGPAYRYIRASDKLPRVADCETPTMARVKLFDPTGSWTWYISAYDPDTRLAFGLVDGFEKEYGAFYMPELVDFRGRFRLPLERDLHWTPTPMAEID